MSAMTQHIRVSAWAVSGRWRAIYGVLTGALLMPVLGFVLSHLLAELGELGVGSLAIALSILIGMGPMLGLTALSGDKGPAALPTLPLSPAQRVVAETLGALSPSLLAATLLPLAGFLAFEPMIAPAFDNLESPWVVLFWGWAFWGDQVAQCALLGAVMLAPGTLLGAHERAQGAPLGLTSLVGMLATGGVAFGLYPFGVSASVVGLVLLSAVFIFQGERLARALTQVSLRPRRLVALHRAPIQGLGGELVRNLGKGLSYAGIATGINLLFWYLGGLLSADGAVTEAWVMGLGFLITIGAIPAGQLYQTHGGEPFDLRGALGWLPRPLRWHLKLAMAQGAAVTALTAGVGGALAGMGTLEPLAALTLALGGVAVTAAICAQICGGRLRWAGLAVLGTFGVAVMAEMLLAIPYRPELPSWLAALPGGVVLLGALPTLAWCWMDAAEG